MKLYGLIGYPLSHSFSKGYFTDKFEKDSISDSIYENFTIESIDEIINIIKSNSELIGLNVTIPYKEQVIQFLNETDDAVKEIGAVNTIKIKRENNKIYLKGYNTDVYGFENSLKPLFEDYDYKALILGTGGASKAIKYILKQLYINYISASIEELKENEIRYNEIDKNMIMDRLLIINATPLGTYPNVDACPDIPYESITEKHILFDLVYNPAETLFLSHGKKRGAKVKNGLEMLHLQAEKSYEIWNNPNL
ncbi:shikimate dehydrogenase family protein [Bacteroidota bacterium]